MFALSDFYGYCRGHDVGVYVYRGVPGEGVTIRDRGQYAVFLDIEKMGSTRRLKGVCAHELGHIATGALHKVDSPYETVERSEYRANRWTAEKYITEADFRMAFDCGCRELWQVAEFFDLPEEDVQRAYQYWTQSKGVCF